MGTKIAETKKAKTKAGTTITFKAIIVILLAGTLFTTGCSSMRENPDDSFAPRPENAKSLSYHLVRLNEVGTPGKLDKASLIKLIEFYRKQYEFIKTSRDFGNDYYGQSHYQDYLVKVQAFKDSDLSSAEKYLKSLPDSIAFKVADQDEKKYDIGDINWHDKARTLHVVDFYKQKYSDDWSPYALIINFIPTAKDGYGKLQFSVNGESLSFRKKIRKKIWGFSPNYFWVYTKVLTSVNGGDQAPMLLIISDPNDHGDMNGIYLVMPRAGASAEAAAPAVNK